MATEASTLKERAKQRRGRIVAHMSQSHAEAESWDLQYWQSLTPQARLSALVAIHRDVAAIRPDFAVPVSRWSQ